MPTATKEQTNKKVYKRAFFYGIFLDESTRRRFGITARAHYTTVPGFSTKGGGIVEAFPIEGHTLTGVIVDVPQSSWARLDQIESGYDRITITTINDVEAEMYVEKGNFPDHLNNSSVRYLRGLGY